MPDPKSTFEDESSEFGEEAGQRYPTRFWREARQSGFMQSLKAYPGGIHLVYGEDDV